MGQRAAFPMGGAGTLHSAALSEPRGMGLLPLALHFLCLVIDLQAMRKRECSILTCIMICRLHAVQISWM